MSVSSAGAASAFTWQGQARLPRILSVMLATVTGHWISSDERNVYRKES